MTTSQTSSSADRELFVDAFWISPWVFTCFVALEEKKLAFKATPIALQDKAQRDPHFQASTITGRVPALRDGNFYLAESQAIVDYLEEAYPDAPRVLPVDVRDRARARQILAWLRSDIGPVREERPTSSMFYERAKAPLSADGKAAADKLVRVASLLVPEGSSSIFGHWTIVDSDLAFALHRLILNGEEVPAKLRAFAATAWARPSSRAFVERTRENYVPY